MYPSIDTEIAQAAAALVVDEGLEYGLAKRRALKQLGLPARTALPSNEQVEDAVREHLALLWMERLAQFRPYVGGAVWRGTATRLTDVYLQLFCDDSKSAEIALIDKGVDYEVQTVTGLHGQPVEALSLGSPCPELDLIVGVHLLIYDLDDLRGALRADARGRTPRGDAAALRQLLQNG